MTRLPRSLAAYGSPAFEETLKQELARLPAEALPLQQGLRHGSVALNEGIGFMLLDTQQDSQGVMIRLGVFYHSIIAGCSCSDDPTPIERNAEYCEIQLRIAQQDARASFSVQAE
jgi:hypothetical protein